MPPKLPFILLAAFPSNINYQVFKNALFSYSTTHTKNQNCTICSDNDHKMKMTYGICTNANCNQNNDICSKRYKTLICEKTSKIEMYHLGNHKSEIDSNKVRGLTPIVKDIIEELIHLYDARPKRIFISLQQPKFTERIDSMPTLYQIQNYIRNRRRLNGDINDLDQLMEFCQDLKYIEGQTEKNQFFTFGERFGLGSDTDHFQLGIYLFLILISMIFMIINI